MGFRVTVREGERIGEALRRLRKMTSGIRGGEVERTWRQTEPSMYRRWFEVKKRDRAKSAARMRAAT